MSRKEASSKTNAARILDRAGIPYELRAYVADEEDISAPHVAEATALPPEQVFKTLPARGDRTGVLLACIPGSAELDLKALADASDNRKVELAALKDVLGLTGYIRGGVSPRGTKKPLFLDQTVLLRDVVWVSAGVRGSRRLLTPADLAPVAEAQLCDIARFS